MLGINKEKRYKKILYSPISVIFLLLILLLLGKAILGAYQKERLSYENLSKDKSELQALLDRKKNLAQSVEYLKTEEGVEAEIRSKFRVAKEGESVAVIVDNDATSVPKQNLDNNNQEKSQGFWEKLLNFIGF